MQQSTAAGCAARSKSSRHMGSTVDRLSLSGEASRLGPPPPHNDGVRRDDCARVPFNWAFRHVVRTLVRRGERGIVVDLAGVSRIDAAGIGQLVRAYNIAAASGGALRIVNTSSRVREMLERVRLFARFSADPNDTNEPLCEPPDLPHRPANSARGA